MTKSRMRGLSKSYPFYLEGAAFLIDETDANDSPGVDDFQRGGLASHILNTITWAGDK